jgi:hypothetical protein
VHKAILVDADINECAKGGNIGNDAFKLHSRL